MLLMESIIAANCYWGDNDGCQNSLQAYVKYTHIDEKSQVITDEIKKEFPAIYVAGILVGAGVQRKYKTMITGNIGLELDVVDTNNPKETVFWKYSF